MGGDYFVLYNLFQSLSIGNCIDNTIAKMIQLIIVKTNFI